jgi:nitrilase
MTTGAKMRVAAVQTVFGRRRRRESRASGTADPAGGLGRRAPVVLPEYFGIFGAAADGQARGARTGGAGPQQAFLARLAQELAIWLVGGTVPLACEDPRPGAKRLPRYGPDGRRVARYDKMHLFAFARGEERYDEAATIEPAPSTVARSAVRPRRALGVLRRAVSRALPPHGDARADPRPAAFTATTGAAHWHLLLRARAVENQCYVLAAAQGGLHPNGRRTYGHSLLIDPWGAIVAEREEGTGIVAGDVDPGEIAPRARGTAGARASRAVDDKRQRVPMTIAAAMSPSTIVTSRISHLARSRNSGRLLWTRRKSSRSRAGSIRSPYTRIRTLPRRGPSAA